MRALVLLALVLGAVAVASAAAATVYVPGQYKDGIYIRPHFLDFPGQSIGGPLLLPPDAPVQAHPERNRSTPAARGPRDRGAERATERARRGPAVEDGPAPAAPRHRAGRAATLLVTAAALATPAVGMTAAYVALA